MGGFINFGIDIVFGWFFGDVWVVGYFCWYGGYFVGGC